MNARLVIALFIAAFVSTTYNASAQGAIDSVIESVQRNSDVETTYTERRDDNHRLYRISIILTFSDSDIYNRLVRAFEIEREKTYHATKMRDAYIYKFRSSDGDSSYTLTRSDGAYTLIKVWQTDGSDCGDCSIIFDGTMPDLVGVNTISTTTTITIY